jgi:phosphodiesterase/alkaline phosphatase D-like protein
LLVPSSAAPNDRPLITHGLQSGDVTADSAVIWARADRPARMLVEDRDDRQLQDVRNLAFVDALPESDFTAKLLVEIFRPPRTSSIAYGFRISPHRLFRVNQSRALPHRAERQAFHQFRVVGRHRRTRLGHR